MQPTDAFAGTPLNDRSSCWTPRSAKDGACRWTHWSEDTDGSTQPGTPRTESVCSDESGSFISTADISGSFISVFLEEQNTNLESDSTSSKVYWGMARGLPYTELCLADEDRLAEVNSISEEQNTRVESEFTTSKIYCGLICGDTGMDLILSDEECFADTSTICSSAIELGDPTWEAGKTLKNLMQALWDLIFSESSVEALGSACKPKDKERSNSSRTQGCDMHTSSRRMSTSRHVLCDVKGLQEKFSPRRQNSRKMQECVNKMQAKAGLRAIKEDGTFHGTFTSSNSIPIDRIDPTSCAEALPGRIPKLLQCIDYLVHVHPAMRIDRINAVSGWECVASSV